MFCPFLIWGGGHSTQKELDLHLGSIGSEVRNTNDHDLDGFAPVFSRSKYHKDKRKAVIVSKSVLDSVSSKNTSVYSHDVFSSFVIVMGFELHLFFLGLDNEM